ALRKVEAHLPAEDAERAGAGAIAPLDAVLQDVGEQRQILPLRVIGGRDVGRLGSLDGGVGVHGGSERSGRNRIWRPEATSIDGDGARINAAAAHHPAKPPSARKPSSSGRL